MHKIPRYVLEIASRLEPAPISEQSTEYFGYTYRLHMKPNTHSIPLLEEHARKLMHWAEFLGATVKYHGRNRSYILMTITDPVALYLETRAVA